MYGSPHSFDWVDRNSKRAVSGEWGEAGWVAGGEHGVDCRQLPTKRGLLGGDRRCGGGKKGRIWRKIGRAQV